MKDISEIQCGIIDAGTFSPLACMMGKACKSTWYYSPWESEFAEIERCVLGAGFDTFDRMDEFMDPEVFDATELWLMPDVGFGGLQRYLRREGKLVWGSFGASDLELYRTLFLSTIEKLGLPMVPTVRIEGVTALAEHLKPLKDKWVKLNRYRGNCETFHWQDWAHGQRDIERLAFRFGPLKDYVVFVVQDPIKGDKDSPVLEIGYDGWLITSPDGEALFPESVFSGYELKNKLYLGSLLEYKDLPESVREVTETFAKVLVKYGYRNFMANELRIKDGIAYFIDPTNRMAGQTMEHLLLTCTNLPQVILAGAQGQNLKPEYSHSFAAEATLHYTAECDGWKTFVCPEEVEDKVMLYRCCKTPEGYQFPAHKLDELGVIIGQGDDIQGAVDDLYENFEVLSDEPVSIDKAGFADLVKQIQEAEENDVQFSDQPVPEPEEVVT